MAIRPALLVEVVVGTGAANTAIGTYTLPNGSFQEGVWACAAPHRPTNIWSSRGGVLATASKEAVDAFRFRHLRQSSTAADVLDLPTASKGNYGDSRRGMLYLDRGSWRNNFRFFPWTTAFNVDSSNL
jgi:hypothetical protein